MISDLFEYISNSIYQKPRLHYYRDYWWAKSNLNHNFGWFDVYVCVMGAIWTSWRLLYNMGYKEFCILLGLLLAREVELGILHRVTRGLLSRTGFCPNPRKNFQVKDERLNFYGTGYLLPASESSSTSAKRNTCQESECSLDYHCEGDQLCCKNVCGASVCTQAVRDPHPCSLFTCPDKKICKLQRVRCIFPDCPDLYAIPRPICVPARLVPDSKDGQHKRVDIAGQYIYPEHSFFHQAYRKRSGIPVTPKIYGLFYVYPEKPFYQRSK